MRELSKDKLFSMTTEEREAYHSVMFASDAVKLAKRTARSIASRYFATHEAANQPMSVEMATGLAKASGVKKELCGYTGRIAMRLITERGVR